MADCSLVMSWNNLPLPIMTIIYSYLTLKEKLTVSTICKAWRESLLTPRNLKIKGMNLSLNCSSLQNSKQNPEDVIELFKKFGKFCSHLFVNWCSCYDNLMNPFFSSVEWKVFAAQSLSIMSNSNTYCRMRNSKLDTNAMRNFPGTVLLAAIEMMKKLKSFSTGYECTIGFFGDYQSYCFSKIDVLNIAFIKTDENLTRNICSDYRWTESLKFLTMNYEYISPKLLETLAMAKKITNLNLLLQGTKSGEVVSNDAWENLRISTPHLKVGMVIVEDDNSNDIIREMAQNMNLHSLKLIYKTPIFYHVVFESMKLLFQDSLEKVSVYFVEKTKIYSYQEWTYPFENYFFKVKEILLMGLPVFPDEVISLAKYKAANNVPLEKFVAPKEDMYVDSECSPSFCLPISTVQLRKEEREISRVLKQPWRASKDTFLWRKKKEHFSFEAATLEILQSDQFS